MTYPSSRSPLTSSSVMKSLIYMTNGSRETISIFAPLYSQVYDGGEMYSCHVFRMNGWLDNSTTATAKRVENATVFTADDDYSNSPRQRLPNNLDLRKGKTHHIFFRRLPIPPY